MKILGQRDLLINIVTLLGRPSVRYLLTGSLAVSYYGYPRATHDIDFVVAVAKESLSTLQRALSSLGKEYIHDLEALTRSDRASQLYTLYHTGTGIKIDFWLVDEPEFEHKWKRRHNMLLGRHRITLVSPEDLLLTKLTWCKEVWSDRHFRDCVGIWQIQGDKLDCSYLAKLGKAFGIQDLLEKIQVEEY